MRGKHNSFNTSVGNGLTGLGGAAGAGLVGAAAAAVTAIPLSQTLAAVTSAT